MAWTALSPKAARAERRINRRHSRIFATFVPWSSIVLASILPTLQVAGGVALVPPLGFMLLLAWRIVRPGLLPVWAGAALGLVDDLFSGQPLGFGIATWSLAMLTLEWAEIRFPWRGFAQEWLIAGAFSCCIPSAGRFFPEHPHALCS